MDISSLISDAVENMRREEGDCRPLEWRRASTPLKCSSLNITVKEGRWRWGGWQFLNNIKIMKSVVLVCTPNVRVEDL